MKITETEFRDLMEKTKVPVVACFFASWCGPCRAFAPVFERVSEKMAPGFAFCKLDIDEATQLCGEVGVRVVPTVMLFNKNRVVATHDGGFAGERELQQWINTNNK